MKKWLEKNKIYFDTIGSVSIALLSVLIGYMAFTIQNSEYNLSLYEKFPDFAVQTERYTETKLIGHYENGEEVYGNVNLIKYIVINRSGSIKNVKITIQESIIAYDKYYRYIEIPIAGNSEIINYDYIENRFEYNPNDDNLTVNGISNNLQRESENQNLALNFTYFIKAQIKYDNFENKSKEETVYLAYPEIINLLSEGFIIDDNHLRIDKNDFSYEENLKEIIEIINSHSWFN